MFCNYCTFIGDYFCDFVRRFVIAFKTFTKTYHITETCSTNVATCLSVETNTL